MASIKYIGYLISFALIIITVRSSYIIKKLPIIIEEIYGQGVAKDLTTLEVDGRMIRISGVHAKENEFICGNISIALCQNHLQETLNRIIGQKRLKCSVYFQSNEGVNYASCRLGSVQIAQELLQTGYVEKYGFVTLTPHFRLDGY